MNEIPKNIEDDVMMVAGYKQGRQDAAKEILERMERSWQENDREIDDEIQSIKKEYGI